MAVPSFESSFEQQTLDGLPTRKVLEGLARLHEWVVVVDSHHHIVWMSDALAGEVGGSERYVGATCRELFPKLPRSVYSRFLGDRVRRGETLQGVRLELPEGRGQSLAVDLSAFPVMGGDGQDPLIVLIVRRVEERVRSRREQSDDSSVIQEILAQSPDGVITLDRSNFITYANPAAESLLGERPGGTVGKPLAMVLPQAEGFGRIASTIRPHRNMTRREFEFRRKDGSRVWISLSTRAIRDTHGRVEGNVAYLRDVTERRRILGTLKRKNSELEGYVHTVSHDLRSPLVAILGFSRLLREDYQHVLGETGSHFLDRIEQAGRTMEALIHDLLELSRIGSPEERRTLVDPLAVLQQLRAELKPRLEEGGTRLTLPEAPPLLLCDRTRIYQLFSNLVGNALTHMGAPDDPTIAVSVDEEPDCHHIRVRDNGRGIPPEAHKRVFEIFETLGRRNPADRSTGIGLAIVKKVAESHGGHAWVESEPGSGSTFHVTLARS